MPAVERGEDHVELQTRDKVGGTVVPSSPTCANRPSAQCRSKNTGAWQPPSTRASGGSQRPLEGAGGGGEGTGSQCLVWLTPTLLALLPEAAGVCGLCDARVPGEGENDEGPVPPTIPPSHEDHPPVRSLSLG